LGGTKKEPLDLLQGLQLLHLGHLVVARPLVFVRAARLIDSGPKYPHSPPVLTNRRAIVIARTPKRIRKPGPKIKRHIVGREEEQLPPDYHKRRGDVADALFREIVARASRERIKTQVVTRHADDETVSSEKSDSLHMRGEQKVMIAPRASTRVIVSRDPEPLTALELRQAAESLLAEIHRDYHRSKKGADRDEFE
jgi:hypothetical protein